MEKLFIKNGKNQKIAVVVEQPKGDLRGLAFVMHGLGGFKEQLHIRVMAETFLENGYTVVTFDTINTYGESEGNYENANITNYFEDLENVIDWSKKQSWYKQPFILAGHSLGGISTALFAEKSPQLVKALAPISTIVKGELNMEKYKTRNKKELEIWEKTGIKEEISESKPGLLKRLKWHQFKEDLLNYDLLKLVHKLTMPVLLIAGDRDDILDQQKILFENLPGRKELHIVPGADHNFRPHNPHLRELKEIFDKWIKSLN